VNATLNLVWGDFAELLNPLDVIGTQAHPSNDPEQWNAEQLVEHLLLTYLSTEDVLSERLRKGRPTQAPVTSQHKAMQEWVFSTGSFPSKREAPETVRPGQLNLPALSGPKLAERMRQELETMDQLIDSCGECFGEQAVASHFALGPLSGEQWRQFHVIHSRHHLPQLDRISQYVVSSGKTSSTT
jgi:hypothetical protein